MTNESPITVLASGFEPFNGQAINPSWQCLHAIRADEFINVSLHKVQLPVARARAANKLIELIDDNHPDIVLMFGEAGGRSEVTPERVAINVDDYDIPDADGMVPCDEPIVAKGESAYFSTLPIRTMVEALRHAGVPAAISNSAGTYLCNHVFYHAMRALHGLGRATLAGFVHLPRLPQQCYAQGAFTPSLDAQIMQRAVSVCIETAVTAARYRLRHVNAGAR